MVFIVEFNVSIKSFPDICLYELFSFWNEEFTLEVCPDFLNTPCISCF